uniref:Copia protein n=1 Tax=Tanacetum cinerariifolium TaxID=118510 RepID=A0A699GTG8_TANCI|nr:copia protein [Tanacetum cinerariifolium]
MRSVKSKEKSKEKGVSSIRLTRGVIIKEASKTASRPIVPPQQQLDLKDKGKGIMQEPEKPVKVKGKDQIALDEEDNTQAMMEEDYELAQRLQAEEHEELTIEEISKLFVELMDKRKKHFAKLRAKEGRIAEFKRLISVVEVTAVNMEVTTAAFVSCDGLGGYDWSDQEVEGLNYALMAFSSSSSNLKIVDNCKKGLGYKNYNAVPPPYTGNFMPPTPDLSFTGLDEFVNKPVVENGKAKSSKKEPKVVRKNDDAPIIEEWVSDNEEEDVSQHNIEKKTYRPSIAKIEFVKSIQQEKTARKTVKQVEQHRQNTHNYKEIDGGYVAFGGNPKRGKITGKCTVKTDHLGKFDGKADEGFFVGYSLNSKVFRVFNSRTRIAKENLHIRFSESTPDVVGTGPDWLFDIDALIRTMNYEPIVVDPKSSHDDKSSDDGKKVDKDPRKESEFKDQEKKDNFNSTSNVNTAGNVNTVSSTVNVTSTNEDNELPFDPNMPALEDDEDGEEVDVHMYRSMIGSLMYLTSSRPNIRFAVCACAIYQANPKVSHLHDVKGIFRSTAMAKTINEEAHIHAQVDGKEIVITESSVRRDLQLVDKEGIDYLGNFTIFEQLTLMGPKTTAWNEFSSMVKDNQEKDKIGTKPDKNRRRGEAEKSQKQLQSRGKEKLKKMQKEGPKIQNPTSFNNERRKKGPNLQLLQKCSSCGALYTRDYSCLKGSVEDKILVPKPPKNCARCAKCGHPVNGLYCQGCALLREKLEKDLVTYFQNFQNTFESSDDSTNVVNAPREPFVIKKDHGVNPPHIDKCCCECGNALDGIFCQQCICKSRGKGAHTGYNCPPKVSIISNLEPCNQTMNNELPQTLPSFDPSCYSEKENSNRPAFYDDDDVDYTIAITPVLSTKEPIDSLSMGNEHLDTISAMRSDEVIKSSVENLVPILSESEGISEHMCDVPFHDNSPSLDVSKDQIKDFSKSNNEVSSIDDDSFSIDNIDFVEASPPDSELVSSEVMEIVIPKFLTKSSSTSPKSFLEETNSFHNSLPEFKNFYFDLEEISSGSTTTHSDISLPDYEAFSFNNDHIKEISSGGTTTHSDSLSEYDSFTFDLSNDQFPPTDRIDFTHEEFADELAHIISLPEYDCFYFWNLPDPGELMSVLNSEICENLSTTCVNLPIEDDHFPLLAYVVWIFLAYLTYPVIPPYLHSFGNEDTIFDPGITINHFYSFNPGLSHRCGAFKKFNTYCIHLNEWPMIINGKNTPILDVLLFHFYPLDQLNLLHLAGSQPMLKSSYKAKDGVIISIPPLVGGVADVKFDFESGSISITFRFSVGLQTPDDLSRSRLGFIEKMGVHG